MQIPFHLAFPVKDLEATEDFYKNLIGCRIGRRSDRWIDFDFFGHQITAHLKPEELKNALTNEVDGDSVPVRHFGAVLPWEDWHRLADRMKEVETEFVIQPHTRFQGEPGEQATMFFMDPSGNALEFKSFKDPSKLFATT
ncbi:MAG: VOC family protein [Cyclobacteriaceae bacterium]